MSVLGHVGPVKSGAVSPGRAGAGTVRPHTVTPRTRADNQPRTGARGSRDDSRPEREPRQEGRPLS
ncbi:hypothetical protein ACFPM0_16195 [Pseudonocardia sulfidoxydans]|uniref:hypothetical protein n=1 Tax=Pseudonocardia sulfidoxydans TaxID=54011 RepID=UPI00360C7BF7